MTSRSLELYPDTSLIPWPKFVLTGIRRRKEYVLYFLFANAALIYLAYSFLSSTIVVLAVPAIVVAIAIGLAVLIDKQLTTEVVVYRPDSSGLTCEDWQRWWISDALNWPDAFRFDYYGKRTLFIDGQLEQPIPFRPWSAEQPKTGPDGKLPVTGTRVASVAAKSKSVNHISRFRPATRGEQIQQGLMVGAIAVSLVAILMAADRVSTILGLTV